MLAFAVALVWALHPLQTETVIDVTQRTESLLTSLIWLRSTEVCGIRDATSSAVRRTWLALMHTRVRRGHGLQRSDGHDAGDRVAI